MKKIAQLFTASALLITGATAAPFLAVGDGAEVFLTGTLGARADSNVFLAPSTTKDRSDTIIEATPGLELVFGKASTLQGSLTLAEQFLAYSDHSDLNTSLFSTNFNAGFADGKTKGGVTAGFSESDQNQVNDLGGNQVVDFLIHRKSTNAGAKGEVSISQKTTIGAGLDYAKSDYSRTGFYDSESVTIPVNAYYEVTPKVDVSLGYQYRKSWLEGIAPDAEDNFFNVGARGEFTPKLSGQFNVGLTKRTFAHLDDANLVGVSANFSYANSAKTTTQFGVSNDFDTNSQGEQQKNFALRGSVRAEVSSQWSLSTGLSYRAIDYYRAKDSTGKITPRTDDYFEFQVGATYVVSEAIRITGSYVYKNNRSDLASSKFDSNLLSLSANFRY